jgi:zinc transport system substrate-binding protein
MKMIKQKYIRRIVTMVLVAAMAMSMTACGGNSGAGSKDGKITVVTTIFPEYDWVREIVGQGTNSTDTSAADSVDVTMLLDNGVDLHSYQPSAADIAKVSSCDIFIYVGGESDTWVGDVLKEAVNKDMVVINLMDVLGDQVKEEEVVEGMEAEEEEEEADNHDGDADSEDEEGEGHHHEEGEKEYDEHIWLSLLNAKICVQAISDALCKKAPEFAEFYKQNTATYIEELEMLDSSFRSVVATSAHDTLIFCDRFPFRYLTEDYGLNYTAAFDGCSAETEASFETIANLSKALNESGVNAVIVLENNDKKIAKTVISNAKKPSCNTYTLDSLQSTALRDAFSGKTYIGTMRDNLGTIKKALE